MIKYLARLVVFLLILVGLAAAALFALPRLDDDFTKGAITSAVTAATGWQLEIAGDLQLEISLAPRIEAHEVTLRNPGFTTDTLLARAGTLTASLDPMAWFRGQAVISTITASDAEFRIDKHALHGWNWRPNRPSAVPAVRPRIPPEVIPRKLRVVESRVLIDGDGQAARLDIGEANMLAGDGEPGLSLELAGAYNDVPLSIKGNISDRTSLYQIATTTINVDGRLGDLQFDAAGAIDNLMRAGGMRVSGSAAAASLDSMAPVLNRFGVHSGSAAARFELETDASGRLAVPVLDLHIDADTIKVDASGSADWIEPGGSVDLNFTVDSRTLGILNSLPHVSGLDEGVLKITGRLVGGQNRLDLELASAELESPYGSARASGTINGLGDDRESRLDTSADVFDLNGLMSHFGLKRALPDPDRITSTAEIHGNAQGFSLRNGRGKVADPRGNAGIEFSIANLGRFEGFEATLSLNTTDRDFLAPLYTLPEIAPLPLQATAQLAGNRKVLKLTNLVLDADDGESRIAVSGMVANVIGPEGLKLNIAARLNRPAAVWPVLGFFNEPLEITATLDDAPEGPAGYRFSGLVGAEGVQLDAAGLFTGNGSEWAVAADTSGTTSRMEVLATLFKRPEIMLFERAVFSSRLSFDSNGDLDLNGSELNATGTKIRLNARGDLSDLRRQWHAAVRSRLIVEDFSALEGLGYTLIPATGNALAVATVEASKSGPIKIEDATLDVEVAHNHANLVGSVDDLWSGENLRFSANVEADSLRDLVRLGGGRLDLDLPVRFDGDIATDAGVQVFKVRHMELGDSRLSGTVQTSNLFTARKSQKPTISGRLDLENLDLVQMFPPGEADIAAAAGKTRSKSKRLFSSREIPVDWIDALNIDVELLANQVIAPTVDIADARIEIDVNDGNARINLARGRMAEGSLTLDLSIDRPAGPPRMRLEVHARSMDVSRIGLLRNSEQVQSGILDVDLKFAGTGGSVADIAAGANGELVLEIRNGSLPDNRLHIFGADLFSQTLNVINPLKKKEENTRIECAVVSMDIKDGIASTEKGLAIKTPGVTVLGSGVVDLSDESMEILINPKARKGFGVSASSLARIVRLGGTLARPEVEPDPTGVLKTGASLGAAFFTGGWTLLVQGLVDRNQANRDVCAVALGNESIPLESAPVGKKPASLSNPQDNQKSQP